MAGSQRNDRPVVKVMEAESCRVGDFAWILPVTGHM